jgi:hypothetical protein
MKSSRHFWTLLVVWLLVLGCFCPVWTARANPTELPPPVPIAPENTDWFYDDYRGMPILQWNPVAEAISYETQVSFSSNFQEIEASAIGLTETQWQVPEIIRLGIDSRYTHWRVRAYDNLGEPGQWSETRGFELYRSRAYLVNPIGDETPTTLFCWWGVRNASSYHLIVDDSPLFNSPEVNDYIFIQPPVENPGIVNHNISISLPQGTRFYWKVITSISWFQTGSDVKSFMFQYSGPTSCPVLFSHDGEDFQMENPLMTACEQSGYRDVVTDFYKLRTPPVARDGELVFQLRELENEITYLDDIELITIDHPSGTQAGVTVDGEIYLYSEDVPPLSVVDDKGNSQLEAVAYRDNRYFRATGPGYLVITFPNERGIRGGVITDALKKAPCPIKDPSPPPFRNPGSLPDPISVQLEVLGKDGIWVGLPSLPSRHDTDQEYVLNGIPEGVLDNQNRTTTIRISWKGEFSADVIRPFTALTVAPEIQVHPAESFTFSDLGDKAGDWAGPGRGQTLTMVKGDVLEFSFSVEPLTAKFTERAYVIKSVGRYAPDYSVYTNLTPVKFQLHGNHPNPFNPKTVISYDLPGESHVRVEIFDIHGRKVLTLVDEIQGSGYHQEPWLGVNAEGSRVADGIYLYQISVGGEIASGKMTILK